MFDKKKRYFIILINIFIFVSKDYNMERNNANINKMQY